MEIEPPPALLDASTAPVPVDAPFTRALARREGVTDRTLARWVREGLVVTPLRGVYYASQLPDDQPLRLACVGLIAPEGAVVTDRTAGYVHHASMILAPNEHLVPPPVSMFLSPGNRMRNKLVVSGERRFDPGDVVRVGDVLATGLLRTACDLGMRLRRDAALAAMDQIMAVADPGRDFDLATLCEQGRRFRGRRGVVQLRELAPWVDGRSQSPPESVLRLRWIDCPSLPRPEPQVAVRGSWGTFYVDLGVEGIRYAAEYDGRLWHGPERIEHDRERRGLLREEAGWTVDVFTAENIYGRQQDAEPTLRAGVAAARRALGWRRTP